MSATGTLDTRAFAEIVACIEDTGRIVDAAVRNNRTRDVEALRAKLRKRLDDLDTKLDKIVSPSTMEGVLVPLVVFLDERVQTRLAREGDPESPPWPLLQWDLLGETDGGDEFFERAALLTPESKPEPLVVATYLHCLECGFVGRHFDEPQEIRAWKERLARCLPRSEAPQKTAAAPTVRARAALRYALLALGVAAGFHAVFALVSLLW
ncbi:DotU family type IV/VI secretion system protein [Polyangium sp. 15x6]|uniref:DotU family type IV/VI secretion system protein n=1 Tax=Polyangium sp. 15x6 TaxID=3042687 RepID=UPI00249C5953|nr:DotU family type IV/VI secretion system protein [Polyangium sp. 15x6]MDI3286919.1 DotU family type IV/VI secretion system protein [Polyangium sp. 15x6]